jgi:hypothetical protein
VAVFAAKGFIVHSGMKKSRTYQQVQTAKDRAARFIENVLYDEDRAEEVKDESVEDYADRRRIRIIENPLSLSDLVRVSSLFGVMPQSPRKAPTMATKAELQEAVNEAADKITELLDPELTREEIVRKAKELDELLNGGDDSDDDDDEGEDEDGDDSAT